MDEKHKKEILDACEIAKITSNLFWLFFILAIVTALLPINLFVALIAIIAYFALIVTLIIYGNIKYRGNTMKKIVSALLSIFFAPVYVIPLYLNC